MTRKQYSKCKKIISESKEQVWLLIAKSGLSNEKEIINNVYMIMSEKLACFWNADPSKVTSVTLMQEVRCIVDYQKECSGCDGAERWFYMRRLIEKIGWILAMAYSQQLSQESESVTFFAAPTGIAV